MNSQSSMSQRGRDAAQPTRGALSVQAPPSPSPDGESCGHCSPNPCVDHSHSGFTFIRLLPLPPLGVTVRSVENKCLQGLARPGVQGGTARAWRWMVADVKAEAVVKIRFLLLFLTRHFFFVFFANIMFLRFFFSCIHTSVFSSDLTFLCKHIHAHTLVFMNMRSSASNSLGWVLGVQAEDHKEPATPYPHLPGRSGPWGLWLHPLAPHTQRL